MKLAWLKEKIKSFFALNDYVPPPNFLANYTNYPAEYLGNGKARVWLTKEEKCMLIGGSEVTKILICHIQNGEIIAINCRVDKTTEDGIIYRFRIDKNKTETISHPSNKWFFYSNYL